MSLPIKLFIAIGTAIIGSAIFNKDNNGDTVDSTTDKPLNNDSFADNSTAAEPLDSTVATVVQPLKSTVKSTVAEPLNQEETERENIRKAMSALGKRSAEKRRLQRVASLEFVDGQQA